MIDLDAIQRQANEGICIPCETVDLITELRAARDVVEAAKVWCWDTCRSLTPCSGCPLGSVLISGGYLNALYDEAARP